MKKFLLSSTVVLISLFYALYQNFWNTSGKGAFASSAPIQQRSQGSNAPPSSQSGGYTDGTYLGSAADSFYGVVQVQAHIQNGKLAAIDFLKYPNDRESSIYINRQAIPILTQEAIQIQSADVDIISGATDSTIAFKESLAVALDKARTN